LARSWLLRRFSARVNSSTRSDSVMMRWLFHAMLEKFINRDGGRHHQSNGAICAG
jgi:hypothetical protein